jgi:hypothetical protein
VADSEGVPLDPSQRRAVKLPGSGLKRELCEAELNRVKRTEPSGGFIRRVRVCPECGHRNRTSEWGVSHSRRDRFSRWIL